MRVAGLARWFTVVELVALVVFLLALNPFISYRVMYTTRIFFVYPLRDIAPYIIASVLLLAVFSYLGILGIKGIDPGRRLVKECMEGVYGWMPRGVSAIDYRGTPPSSLLHIIIPEPG